MEQGLNLGMALVGKILWHDAGIRVALDALNPSAGEHLLAERVAMNLHINEGVDERGNRRLAEWIARGDVDLVDALGQAMDDGLQQSLVAKHDGGAAPGLDALGGEPLADVSGLDILGGCRDVVDMLRWNLVGVLIEKRLALTLKTAEECLLYLLQEVEADEHIGVVLELDALVGSHLAIECALVG